MWDPRNYVDSDFGLDNDESFEPDDIVEQEIETTREAHIMTVLGPIEPDDLGICQVDEHLLLDPPGSPDVQRLDDPVRAIEELTSFVTAGGRAIADATTVDRGRDLIGLVDIARRVPAHVICSTGGLFNADPETVIDELRNGVGLRKIRPGVIRVSSVTDQLRSALDAARETGVPLFVEVDSIHADPYALIQSLVPDRFPVAFVFRGGIPSHELAGKLMAAGGYVVLSGIGHPAGTNDADVARLVVELASGGYTDRLLVSQALDSRSLLHAWGGQPGLVYLLERFTLELMEAGAEATLVRKLLIDNPAAALTIRP
jgi:phosphotriesterase-related protein